jgi:lauroyl/myristoyl acyltransferase
MNKIFEESILIRPEEYSWEYKKFRKIPENKNLYKL